MFKEHQENAQMNLNFQTQKQHHLKDPIRTRKQNDYRTRVRGQEQRQKMQQAQEGKEAEEGRESNVERRGSEGKKTMGEQ